MQPGDLVGIGRAASVQFAGDRALRMRVVSIDEKPTYYGWMWITGYVLDDSGRATERREVYVQRDGVRILTGRTPQQRARPPRQG